MGEESEVQELEYMFTNKTSEPIQISYSVIKSITKNFYQVIGHGGFGVVYLGVLRNDVLIAVKELRLSQDFSDTQFLGEIKCLKKVKHKNIVRFLGYCAYTEGVLMKVEGKDRLVDVPKRFLCFEYAPNGSLHDYLQAAEKTYQYKWSIHYKILRGICQGLHYLHQQRITHLDLKPENVLLGVQMEPKITDFGLSRCNDGTQSTIFTKTLQGTPGYIPPELIDEGKISFKSDIYSLGIIMIRLLTGSNRDIPENWCEPLNSDCQKMETCIEIAKICTGKDPNKRPTIYEIICMLTEVETTIQNIPPVSIIEPRNDQNSRLCQNVKRFLARRLETREYYRLPVERPKLKLAFQSPPKLPITFCDKIENVNGNSLEVILVDMDTGKPSAIPNVLQVEFVPLLGNFPGDYWDADDFEKGVVKDLEGKLRPLLAGEYRLTMWDGRATVNELMFTDESRVCDCMFRIGVRVVPGLYQGARILEAMTEAFMVRDRHAYKLHDYKWQLVFQSQPRFPIYAGSKIRDIIGNPLEVILVDRETGSPSAPPVELDIQLVPLHGHPAQHGSEVLWSAYNFRRSILTQDKGERPLLSGDVRFTMKDDGRITVSDLQFTMSTPYAVRIGVCEASSGDKGSDRIFAAVTKDFMVQDGLNEMSKKHHPPALADEVWRLEGITWGEVFHKRLTQNNIRNVQDFLRMLAVKPDKLHEIMYNGLGDGTCTWWTITRHARNCIVPINKVYAYSSTRATIYVNSIFDLVKVKLGSVEWPQQQLDEAQNILVHQTILEAYEHRHNLQEVQKTWKLAFKSQLRLPIHTGSRVEDCMSNPLEIIIMEDTKTLSPSPWALPMELRIQLVPLLGDFTQYDGRVRWSTEEFRAAIVKRRHNVPLLKGSNDDVIIMRDGRATVDELLQFTDDSSWVRSGKFRIGAYVVPGGSYDGTLRIVEAMTGAFEVRDLNRKHYPPVLSDPVWRLEMIDRDGEFHMTLMSNKVHTVQDFRRMLTIESDKLHAILGDRMTDSMWEMTARHAQECAPGDMVYAYRGAHGTIYIDSVFGRLFKIVINGVECPLRQQLGKSRTLILEAYEHRHNLQEVGVAKKDRDDDVTDIFWLLYSRYMRDSTVVYNVTG